MLGASYASDLIVAAGTSASDLAKKSSLLPTGGTGRKHYVRGGGVVASADYEEDVSKLDRAQAAALVARKFAGGAGSSVAAIGGGPGGLSAMRHRASGKRKRMLQHHLLVEDFISSQDGAIVDAADDNVDTFHSKEDSAIEKDREEEEEQEEVEEEEFAIRPADGARKKSEAKVLVRRTGDERNNMKGRSFSSTSDSVSSSSGSESSCSTRHGRRSGGGSKQNDGGRARSNSSSSSSSSSEDGADIRRRKAREQRAQKIKEGGTSVSSDHVPIGEQRNIMKDVKQQSRTQERDNGDAMSADIKPSDKNSLGIKDREQTMKDQLSGKNRNNGRNRRPGRSKRSLSSSSDKSTSDSFSSSSSDSSSSSSDDESDQNNATLPMPVSKPLFVPKSKRGTVTELEVQHQKHEEYEKRRFQEAEKRVIQSRALVAAAAATATSSAGSHNIGEGDEFDTGEVGGEYIPVPDDTDPTEEDGSPELVTAERNAWEVRELIRILRDVDDALERERERRDLERRRALTDEERLEEDRLSGRFRAPGEARRRLLRREDVHIHGGMGSKEDGRQQQQDESSNRYLQRFHHRGAFYMDEDTLNQAGKDDVRHRAAEYSRAATGEDKIDKSALPKVMQVKKFGFSGYSTKWRGLAKEDTTDKKMDFLPIRGPAASGRSSHHGHGGSGRER